MGNECQRRLHFYPQGHRPAGPRLRLLVTCSSCCARVVGSFVHDAASIIGHHPTGWGQQQGVVRQGVNVCSSGAQWVKLSGVSSSVAQSKRPRAPTREGGGDQVRRFTSWHARDEPARLWNYWSKHHVRGCGIVIAIVISAAEYSATHHSHGRPLPVSLTSAHGLKRDCHDQGSRGIKPGWPHSQGWEECPPTRIVAAADAGSGQSRSQSVSSCSSEWNLN